MKLQLLPTLSNISQMELQLLPTFSDVVLEERRTDVNVALALVAVDFFRGRRSGD